MSQLSFSASAPGKKVSSSPHSTTRKFRNVFILILLWCIPQLTSRIISKSEDLVGFSRCYKRMVRSTSNGRDANIVQRVDIARKGYAECWFKKLGAQMQVKMRPNSLTLSAPTIRNQLLFEATVFLTESPSR